MICLLSIPAFSEQRIEEKGFILVWETEADKLVVTLSAETTGWIAFGIGATSVMRDANIIMLWVDDEMGIAMAEDHFGTGKFKHASDIDLGGSQDVQVLTGRQTEDTTEITFTIPLDSGDEYDTVLERGEVYRLLLASNKSDKITWKHNSKYAADIEIR
nr:MULTISPECIES: DOMON domain-containing protein [unclassified Oceanispirochaeta]